MKNVDEMTTEEIRLEIARLKGWPANLTNEEAEIAIKHGMSLKDWTGDIAAAWELVEEMPECRLIRVAKGTESEIWQCQSQSCGNWGDHTIESHHRDGTHYRCGCIIEKDCTAPLAICRAYVEWKRDIVNQPE